MKSKYISNHTKSQIRQQRAEEAMILQAMFEPNEIVYYRGNKLTLLYPEVVDGVLKYFAKTKDKYVWLPEALILD